MTREDTRTHHPSSGNPVAIVTGASRGLGRALSRALAERGWQLVVDARGAEALEQIRAELATRTTVAALPGDVTDPRHRAELVGAATAMGGLDLLVNNASTLGPTPLPAVADLPLDALSRVVDANLVAPVGLVQLALPSLRARAGALLNLTSDAAVEPYEGWAAYGAAKAALEQASNILAAEEPNLRVWWFDPGDMRTQMHQDAFPGEDISDRPQPEAVVPAVLRLVEERPASGRYQAADLLVPGVAQ